ncbi:hypothetical protein GCM10008967_11640 [Bacillus carboniphilus]|uniref:Uncharacterized protein n=1 Tax=Bacillus carboniphilus TaxID=86663 RepID=A0ABP3FSN0_9BACI
MALKTICPNCKGEGSVTVLKVFKIKCKKCSGERTLQQLRFNAKKKKNYVLRVLYEYGE